ncbi:PIN domain-containing protein, partial [Spirulina sp. 06S082]
MSAIVLDTHTIIWYFLNSPKLSEPARVSINTASQIYIASISLVEMIYLNEKSKIPDLALQRLNQALVNPDTRWLVAVL